MTTRHKVFVSYHHAKDQYYREAFEDLFVGIHDVFISRSVKAGDFSPQLSTDYVRQRIRDDNLRDSTVTVVLVGPETWQRKHVDWEISSSIRHTSLNPRSGLMGILLPNHPSYYTEHYDPGIVPPRLAYNERCGYAAVYNWTTDPVKVGRWIQVAYNKRFEVEPDNSYPNFVNNKFGERWSGR